MSPGPHPWRSAARRNSANGRQSGTVDRSDVESGWTEAEQPVRRPTTAAFCIARAIAVNPEGQSWMDEPAPASLTLSPAKIEELDRRPRENYTVVVRRHLGAARPAPSARLSSPGRSGSKLVAPIPDFHQSRLHKLAEGYIAGRFAGYLLHRGAPQNAHRHDAHTVSG